MHQQDGDIWHEFRLRDECKLMWSTTYQSFAYLDPVSCWVHDSFKQGFNASNISQLLQDELKLSRASAHDVVSKFAENGNPKSTVSTADAELALSDYYFPFEAFEPDTQHLTPCWLTLLILVGGCTIEIRCCGEVFDIATVAQSFSHLKAIADSRDVTHTVNLGYCRSAGLWAQSDATGGFRTESPEQLATLAYWMVFKTVESSRDWLVALHAGGVSSSEQAVIVTGPSGSGKSTLTIALMREHQNYLSDELIVVSRKAHEIYSVPTLPCVKEGSWTAVNAMYPVIDSIEPMERLGKQIKYLTLSDEIRLPQKVRPERTTVLFPEYSPSQEPDLQLLTTGEVVDSFLSSGCLIGGLKNSTQFEDFANWLNGLRGFRLKYSSTEEGLSLVARALTPHQNAL